MTTKTKTSKATSTSKVRACHTLEFKQEAVPEGVPWRPCGRCAAGRRGPASVAGGHSAGAVH